MSPATKILVTNTNSLSPEHRPLYPNDYTGNQLAVNAYVTHAATCSTAHFVTSHAFWWELNDLFMHEIDITLGRKQMSS